jgi:hypothetical protein
VLRAAAVAVALAAGGDRFPELPPEPGPNTRLAVEAVGESVQAVMRRWEACRRDEPWRPGYVDAPIPDAVTGALGVLRRPQTPAEAALAADPGPGTAPSPFPFGAALRSSLRVVRTLADGTQLRLLVSPPVQGMEPRPAACRTREVRELGRRLDGLPTQARRAARRVLRRIHTSERAAASPAEGIYVVATPAREGAMQEVSQTAIGEVRSSGAWATVSRPGHTLLVGAVPDGVARVEVVLPRGRSPFTHRRYGSAPRLSGAVVDNVVAIPVNRPVEDSFMTRMTWRLLDGSARPVRLPRRAFIVITEG